MWPAAELKARAIALAEELAAMPRVAVRAMLECIVGHETKTLAESLQDERGAVHRNTPDQHEGIAAFLEKRKPVFNRG